jgi:hypothetical protein
MVKHLQEFVFPDTILSWNWQERHYEWREAPPKFGTKLPVGIDKPTSLTPHRIYALHAAMPFMLRAFSCSQQNRRPSSKHELSETKANFASRIC